MYYKYNKYKALTNGGMIMMKYTSRNPVGSVDNDFIVGFGGELWLSDIYVSSSDILSDYLSYVDETIETKER